MYKITANIQRLTFDVQYNNKIQQKEAEENIKQLIAEILLPDIESILDKNYIEDQIIVIDKLEIDLTGFKISDFKTIFERELKEEIEKLRKTVNTTKEQKKIITRSAHFIKVIDFYLIHGYFPWWAKIKNGQNFDQFVLQNYEQAIDLLPSFLNRIVQTTTLIKRFTNQLSENSLDEIYSRLFSNFNIYKNQLVKYLNPIYESFHLPFNRIEIYALIAHQHKPKDRKKLNIELNLKNAIDYFAFKTNKKSSEIIINLKFASTKTFQDKNIETALHHLFLELLKDENNDFEKTLKSSSQIDPNSYQALLLISNYANIRVEIKDKLLKLELELKRNKIFKLNDIEIEIKLEILKYFLIYNYYPTWANKIIVSLKKNLNISISKDKDHQLFLLILKNIKYDAGDAYNLKKGNANNIVKKEQALLENIKIEFEGQKYEIKQDKKSDPKTYEALILIAIYGKIKEAIEAKLKELDLLLANQNIKSLAEIDVSIQIEVLKYFLIFNSFPIWAENLISFIKKSFQLVNTQNINYDLFLIILSNLKNNKLIEFNQYHLQNLATDNDYDELNKVEGNQEVFNLENKTSFVESDVNDEDQNKINKIQALEKKSLLEKKLEKLREYENKIESDTNLNESKIETNTNLIDIKFKNKTQVNELIQSEQSEQSEQIEQNIWTIKTKNWIDNPILVEKIIKTYPTNLIIEILNKQTIEKIAFKNFNLFILLLPLKIIEDKVLLNLIINYKAYVFENSLVDEKCRIEILQNLIRLTSSNNFNKDVIFDLAEDCLKYIYRNINRSIENCKKLIWKFFSQFNHSETIFNYIFNITILQYYISHRNINIDFQYFMSIFKSTNLKHTSLSSTEILQINSKVLQSSGTLNDETIRQLLVIVPFEDKDNKFEAIDISELNEENEQKLKVQLSVFKDEIEKIEDRISQNYLYILKTEFSAFLFSIENFQSQSSLDESIEFKNNYHYFENLLNTLTLNPNETIETEFKLLSFKHKLNDFKIDVTKNNFTFRIDFSLLINQYEKLMQALIKVQTLSDLNKNNAKILELTKKSKFASSTLKDKINALNKQVESFDLESEKIQKIIKVLENNILNLLQYKSNWAKIDFNEFEIVLENLLKLVGLIFLIEKNVSTQKNEIELFLASKSELIDFTNEIQNMFRSMQTNDSNKISKTEKTNESIEKQALKLSNVIKMVLRIQNKINENLQKTAPNEVILTSQQHRLQTEGMLQKMRILDQAIDQIRDKDDEIEIEKSKEMLTKLIKETDLFSKLDKNEIERIRTDLTQKKHQWVNNETPEQKIYIENAGLVLFWLYLPVIFARLNYLLINTFFNFKVQERAVHLLQYIATAREFEAELFMPLNKILCGLQVNEPINKDIPLTDKEKEEADSLMDSVIENWPALKGSSKDALREAFIQRPGVLYYKNGNWNLKVEQKAQDVLITKLPWGLSTIKLDWTKYIIFVEWV